MKTYVCLFFSFLFVFSSYGQDVRAEQLDELFDYIESYNQGIGEVVIARNGETFYQRRFGPAELTRQGTAADIPLSYRIGSVTKMLTATLIFQLIEEGALTLDHTLDGFYPNVPNASRIKIRHLLAHTSGLADYAVKEDSLIYWLCEPATEKEIFQEIGRQGVLFEPADSFRYSNTGYYLLTRIVEREYGKPYREVLDEKIVVPLQLTQTISSKSEDPAIAPSYQLSTNREWEVVKDFYFPNVVGLGDVASTPSDLVRIVCGLFDSQLIGKESLEEMKPSDGDTFGKGLMRFPAFGRVFYGHAGDTFGTSSLAVFNPEDSLAIGLSVNGRGIMRNELWEYISAILYEEPYVLPEYPAIRSYRIDPLSYVRYEGSYTCHEPAISLRVFPEGGNLMMQLAGQLSFVLEALEDGVFTNSMVKVQIEFDPENRKLIFKQSGHELEFIKEE